MKATLSRRTRLLRAVGLSLAFSVPVAVLGFVVRVGVPVVVRLDEAAIRAATPLAQTSASLRSVLLGAQAALQPPWVNLAVALVCLWAWRRRGLGTRALWAIITVLLGWGVSNGVKALVGRARPVVEHAVDHAPGYSFPSGHATNTTVAAIVLLVLLWPLLRRRGRVTGVVLAVAVVLAIGLDRVLLGAHFPSDVLGGYLLGGALAAGSALGYLGRGPAAPAADAVPVPAGSSVRPTREDPS